MPLTFLDDRVVLHPGDCLEVLATLPEASVDSVVCDPPYGLGFMGKEWDTPGAFVQRKPAKRNTFDHVGGNHNPCNSADAARTRRVEGQRFGEWCLLWAAELLRVLKPGGHLVAFGGTRTYHRMACAIEDAGFEIRDQIGWCYGSGFPKSHDVSKAIDRANGAERAVVGVAGRSGSARSCMAGDFSGGEYMATAPATEAAKQWEGWGTSLKPSWEPVVLARKPLVGTVAQNVLEHGTGALNIDGCRIGADGPSPAADRRAAARKSGNAPMSERVLGSAIAAETQAMGKIGRRGSAEVYMAERASEQIGRWPANLVHDGSPEVLAAFPDSKAGGNVDSSCPSDKTGTIFGAFTGRFDNTSYGDNGSAARFFYTAKADSEDRLGSKHPTVKPLDLMQWLVRLVTPRGGICLDPFAGTGTSGEAAWREGMRAILIEREPEYIADIERRMELAANPTKRAAVAKTKNNLDDPMSLPLFSST